MKSPHDRGRPKVPPPHSVEIRLDHAEWEVRAMADRALLDVHAVDVARYIAHPGDDVGMIWNADGTALIKIFVWQRMEPPFPHAAYVLALAFDAGRVIEVLSVERVSYGA